MSFDLPALRGAVIAHGRVARVVIVAHAGSAPREAGTAMLVWPGGQAGTIGGGALEMRATSVALEMLERGGVRRDQMPLGPGLGQCCGGAVTLVTEVFDSASLPKGLPFARQLAPDTPRPAALDKILAGLHANHGPREVAGWLVEGPPPPGRPLWIFGAGHVGRALVHVLAPLPDVAITWVDTGPERFPADVPETVTLLPAADPIRVVPHAPAEADHLVLTYAHDLDLALCHAILGRDFGSLGLIGSTTKWARFRSRLAALGHGPEVLARVQCPIGQPALGKHPAALALGVAAAWLEARTPMEKGAVG